MWIIVITLYSIYSTMVFAEKDELFHLKQQPIDVDGEDAKIFIRPAFLNYSNIMTLVPTFADMTIKNLNADHSVEIMDIITEDPQFIPANLERKNLAPGEEMTVQMLFLPFEADTLHILVTIVTSHGHVLYPIHSTSRANPYGLKSYVGNQLIQGESDYNQAITVYNPHEEPLHILEVFTTEKFITLKSMAPVNPQKSSSGEGRNGEDLPDVIEGSHQTLEHATFLWSVQPANEKEIITFSVSAASPGAYRGYVHLATDKQKLVMPVELTVIKAAVVPRPEILDFGTFYMLMERKSLELWLVNMHGETMLVTDVRPAIEDTQITVEISDHPTILDPDPSLKTLAASVTFTSMKAGKITGSLIVETNSTLQANSRFVVDYEANVVHDGSNNEQDRMIFILPIRNKTLAPAPASFMGDPSVRDQSLRDPTMMLCGYGSEHEVPLLSQEQSECRRYSEMGFQSVSDLGLSIEDCDEFEHNDIVVRSIPLQSYFAVPPSLRQISVLSCKGLITIADTDADRKVRDDGLISTCINAECSEARSSDRWPPPVILKFHNSKMRAMLSREPDLLPFTCSMEMRTSASSQRISLMVSDTAMKLSYMDAVSDSFL
jgi:hypothetical protein